MRRAEREVCGKESLEALLKRYQVCRLGLVVDAMPYVVPLNFGYEWVDEWPVIYFHGAAVGKKMEGLAACPQVCLEWDGDHAVLSGTNGCDYSFAFSSLIGEGVAEVLTESAEKRRGLTVFMKQFSEEKFTFSEELVARTAVVRVRLTSLTGKQRKM